MEVSQELRLSARLRAWRRLPLSSARWAVALPPMPMAAHPPETKRQSPRLINPLPYKPTPNEYSVRLPTMTQTSGFGIGGRGLIARLRRGTGRGLAAPASCSC